MPAPTGLGVLARAAGVISATEAFGNLEEAVAIRIEHLGILVSDVDSADVFRLSNKRSHIDIDLATGIADAYLVEDINEYLSDVRHTIAVTNNFGALRDFLNDGYIALVKAQGLPATPGVLKTALAQVVAEGLLRSLRQSRLTRSSIRQSSCCRQVTIRARRRR